MNLWAPCFAACAICLGASLLVARVARAEPTSAPPSTHATAQAKTSLVWILGDDDVFHAPAATSPPSPATSIGDRPGYDGLFEGSSSRYTGRENRLELRFAGQASGFHPLLDTRAEVALGIDATGLGEAGAALAVEDAGSFIELFLRFSRSVSRTPDGVGARLFPLDGDRERLGELEALGVGGEVGPERESPYARAVGPVRAARIWLDLAGVRSFLALKTAAFVEPVADAPAVEETSYALFGGIESRWRRHVGFGLGFGYFEHGRLPSPASPAPRASTTAGSARLSFASGLERPRAPASFGNELPPFDARAAERDEGSGFALGLEGSHILQRLVEFERPDATVLSGARALAALGTVRASRFELRLAGIAREAGFVMRNVPGVIPGQSTPEPALELAELTALASASVEPVEPLRFTLALGVRRPAAVVTRALDRLGQPTGGAIVLEGPNQGELLPAGEMPVPVVDVRPECELRVSRLLEILAWVGYRRDFNHARLAAGSGGTLTRSFTDPNRVSYGIAARAVW